MRVADWFSVQHRARVYRLRQPNTPKGFTAQEKSACNEMQLPTDVHSQTYAIPPAIRLNPEKIEEYLELLTTFLADQQQHPDIDRHASYIQNDFLEAATSAFGTKRCRRHTSFPSNPWYDGECKRARKRLQSAMQVGDPEVGRYRKEYKSMTKRKKCNHV
jgi:hypothetical protein